MKNLYKVMIGRVDGNEGKKTWYDEEIVHTADVDAYVEKKKAEIEKNAYWWITYREDYDTDNRPLVKVEKVEVVEA